MGDNSWKMEGVTVGVIKTNGKIVTVFSLSKQLRY